MAEAEAAEAPMAEAEGAEEIRPREAGAVHDVNAIFITNLNPILDQETLAFFAQNSESPEAPIGRAWLNLDGNPARMADTISQLITTPVAAQDPLETSATPPLVLYQALLSQQEIAVGTLIQVFDALLNTHKGNAEHLAKVSRLMNAVLEQLSDAHYGGDHAPHACYDGSTFL